MGATSEFWRKSSNVDENIKSKIQKILIEIKFSVSLDRLDTPYDLHTWSECSTDVLYRLREPQAHMRSVTIKISSFRGRAGLLNSLKRYHHFSFFAPKYQNIDEKQDFGFVRPLRHLVWPSYLVRMQYWRPLRIASVSRPYEIGNHENFIVPWSGGAA